MLASERLIPYAGGTDIMTGDPENKDFIFICNIPEMRKTEDDGSFIRIGAACTFSEVLKNPLVPRIMREAVAEIGAPAIRNLGTMGGNIANGSAKADTVPVEYACDAKLRIVSARKERIVDADMFFKSRKRTDISPDELIVEILLPKTGLENGYFKKVGARAALAVSRVSFAGVFRTYEGKITGISAAFGAVAETVLRFKDIEKTLIGKTLKEASALKSDFLKAYCDAVVPISGRVSSDYRKKVCVNLLDDFLTANGI
ncbi:MAG: FAD binding domain-containing protein [Oscillospiraceae bacterium]|nr:FAD binding domain-containing protein [Oscillospiraceae bacterium]